MKHLTSALEAWPPLGGNLLQGSHVAFKKKKKKQTAEPFLKLKFTGSPKVQKQFSGNPVGGRPCPLGRAVLLASSPSSCSLAPAHLQGGLRAERGLPWGSRPLLLQHREPEAQRAPGGAGGSAPMLSWSPRQATALDLGGLSSFSPDKHPACHPGRSTESQISEPVSADTWDRPGALSPGGRKRTGSLSGKGWGAAACSGIAVCFPAPGPR